MNSLPVFETIKVTSKTYPHISKNVALLGLCTHDPEVMLPGM